MPSHTEEERKKKLPLLARFGRSLGESERGRREGVAAGNVRLAEARRMSRQRLTEDIEGIKGGFRRFTEGVSAGIADRPVDPNAFEAPRPPAPDTNPLDVRRAAVPTVGITRAPGVADPTRTPTVAESEEGARSRAGIPLAPEAGGSKEDGAAAPVSLGDGARSNVLPRPTQRFTEAESALGREFLNDPSGKLENIPEGFTQIIKGTEIGFSDPTGQQFKSVPGLTIGESRAVAGRRDPAFNVVEQQDVARQRVNAETHEAATNRIEARSASQTFGVINGRMSLLERNDAGILQQVVGVDPYIEALFQNENDIQVIQAGSTNPLTGFEAENTLMVDLTLGIELGDLTENVRKRAAFRMWQSLNGDQSEGEEREEIIAEIAAIFGPVPFLSNPQEVGQ